ncbi:hypothetical protein [Kitasatospora sp. NPDC059673]|uniref:hypothetical protein n=1 Tax=Kitasatospora sp. NPDC059673 TaxID=3346901 RepID=UPI0036C212DF
MSIWSKRSNASWKAVGWIRTAPENGPLITATMLTPNATEAPTKHISIRLRVLAIRPITGGVARTNTAPTRRQPIATTGTDARISPSRAFRMALTSDRLRSTSVHALVAAAVCTVA